MLDPSLGSKRCDVAELPESLALVPVVNIHPGPLQPRTTVSVELVPQLADSKQAGRHEPLFEVEPVPMQPGHYQIACGVQRWLALKEAAGRSSRGSEPVRGW